MARLGVNLKGINSRKYSTYFASPYNYANLHFISFLYHQSYSSRAYHISNLKFCVIMSKKNASQTLQGFSRLASELRPLQYYFLRANFGGCVRCTIQIFRSIWRKKPKTTGSRKKVLQQLVPLPHNERWSKQPLRRSVSMDSWLASLFDQILSISGCFDLDQHVQMTVVEHFRGSRSYRGSFGCRCIRLSPVLSCFISSRTGHLLLRVTAIKRKKKKDGSQFLGCRCFWTLIRGGRALHDIKM